MTIIGPKNPCENCGSTTFTHATPSGHKGALTRVIVDSPDGRFKFVADAGTPVDIYACENCGMLRLFAIAKN
jgi:hypothetical protein